MSLFWNIIGAFVLVFGCIGSFSSGSLEITLVGAISSVITAMACFTTASLLNRVQYMTDVLEEMAENKKASK